jgi:MarR family transcriptional regulator, organic hydroperoxide resistance regulator
MGRKKKGLQEPTIKGFALWQLSNKWQRGMNIVLKDYELTHVQFILIEGMTLLENVYENISQKALSDHANANPMMTSKVIRSLEEKGLILRTNSETDSRAFNLSLTKEGKSIYKKVIKNVKVYDEQFFSSLGNKLNNFFNTVGSLTEETTA